MQKTIISTLLAGALLAVSCGNGTDTSREAAHLQREDWADDVREGLNSFMDDCAGMKNAYVVFDFDNTSAIFDVEEQMTVYQLETMSFALNPKQLADAISTGLESAPAESAGWINDITRAYTALYSKYGPFTPAGLDGKTLGIVHADPQWREFATKMRALYDSVGSWSSTEDAYAWVKYWVCGMTENQVYDLAYASHKKYSAVNTSLMTWTSPAELKSEAGQVSVSWVNGIQVTENIRELWKCLKENGIDVWVCSASGIDQIRAAVDVFGLRDYCTGVLAMTITKDEDGRLTNSYDYTTGYAAVPTSTGWSRGTLATGAQPRGPGKVKAILNAIAPLYDGATPIAGFMDSTGDFNFCTEFKSLRTVVCFNRGTRTIADGGGLIAGLAVYQKESLGYDYAKARRADDTLYLLQGRDENGLRTFRNSNKTIRFGSADETLFATPDDAGQLAEMTRKQLTTKQILDTYSSNFLKEYIGYHGR